MLLADGPVFGAAWCEPWNDAEALWAVPLRMACRTLARSRPGAISAIIVVITLTRVRADAVELLDFSRSLAARNGVHAELLRFAPPTFAVRFSRVGEATPATEGAER